MESESCSVCVGNRPTAAEFGRRRRFWDTVCIIGDKMYSSGRLYSSWQYKVMQIFAGVLWRWGIKRQWT